MKNFFKRITKYSFWVSLSGAVVILLNAFGKAFGFSIDNKIVEDCIMAVAGLLVVLGVVGGAVGQKNDSDNEDKTDDKTNENNE